VDLESFSSPDFNAVKFSLHIGEIGGFDNLFDPSIKQDPFA
jgi:hypothetical protein